MSARADSTRPNDIRGSDLATLLPDSAHGFEFMTTSYQGGSESGSHLQATDPSGSSLKTYDVGPSGGMAIAGTTLYVTDPFPDMHVARLDLGVSPPGELAPISVTRQLLSLVYANGLLWASECLPDSTVESVDPATGAESPQDLTGLDISNCPQFADNPALAKIFYMWSQNHGTLYRVDTTGGKLTAGASWNGSINDVAVSSDGSAVIVGSADGAIELDPTTLAPTGTTYSDGSSVTAVAVSGDGHVGTAAGDHVFVYPSGGSTPNASWAVGGCLDGSVTARGLGFGPSDLQLFVLSRSAQTFSVLSHPTSVLKTSSLVSSSAPPTPTPGDTVTISGTLTVPSTSVAGRTVAIYESGAYNGTDTFIGNATTDAGGAFSLDVPGVTAGGHCFDARFAGTTGATGAVAGTAMIIDRLPSTVSISGPDPSPLPGDPLQLKGTLAFQDAASTENAVIHVDVWDGSLWQPVDDAVVAADGTWSVTTTAGSEGTYSFRARVDQSDRYLEDSAQVDVVIQRSAAKLRLVPSKAVVTYGGWLTLTAHLKVATGATNHKVAFYIDPPSKGKMLLGRVTASSDGIARIRLRPPGNATYEADYAGDARDLPAVERIVVKTSWAIFTGLRHNYAKSGNYHLFHRGVAPLYVVALQPSVASNVLISLQRLGTAWHTIARQGFDTNRDGVVVVIIDPRFFAVGQRYRIVTRTSSAPANGYELNGNVSRYTYLRVTS